MRNGIVVTLLAALIGLGMPLQALAGTFTFHPDGFGRDSYAAWKAQEGLPDSRGDSNQALYFQKLVPTSTFTAGVAEIKGLEGMPVSSLSGLSWDHRVDGHCGAGAPRWNLTFSDSAGVHQTAFFGCYAAQHSSAGVGPNGQSWCIDSIPSSALPAAGTIESLAIVFDEGPDNPLPQPPGCPLGTSAPGFVFLDNISVVIDGQTHTWTYAGDNGTRGG